MVILPEQYGYKNHVEPIDFDFQEYQHLFNQNSYSKFFDQRRDNKGLCYEFKIDKDTQKFKTSYFVGVDWILENELPIFVQPKLNNASSEVNFILMLMEALEDSENFRHLDHLCQISFNKPLISVSQKQDLLSPLLVIQFLNILKKIVQKGLKKSYYKVESNLHSKVKGKILMNPTIKHNHTRLKKEQNFCSYDEFGVNNIENKILKKAFVFAQKQVISIQGIKVKEISSLVNYIRPAFNSVDDNVLLEDLKNFHVNSLFKEYEQALKIAKLILKRFGYNIQNINAQKIKTPPFWIDMSKLFELFVFKKLRDAFPLRGEVTYHKHFNYLEPDYILKSKDGSFKLIVDAKYKPQYEEGNISTEDIRQVSGYARMKSVYDFLNIKDHNTTIDCLIIYSNQNALEEPIDKESLYEHPEKNYVNVYKKGIALPSMVTHTASTID